MHIKNQMAFRITLAATLLALFVIMLGAYTRLKDAGLGCPDWPGCYGRFIAPDSPQRLLQAEAAFPGHTFDERKAWTEMIHRYVAGTLGVLIFVSAILVIRRRDLPNRPIGLSLILLALVAFQILLGKWTVTLRLLPIIVVSHLVGGMAILSLLWLMNLRLGNFFHYINAIPLRTFRPWAAIGLVIVSIQIFLGGWTSANYAALICLDFPFCQGKFLPPMDFYTAFHFWMITDQGQMVDNVALVTIQMMHRFGALITMVYLICLSLRLLFANRVVILQRIGFFILLVIVLQISLGILNVLWLLPVPIAVAHSGMAALLLLGLVTLNYVLCNRPRICLDIKI